VTMDYMFYSSGFNSDISKWNVENVIDMDSMFDSSEFNGDISDWNVRNVQYMNWMFQCSNFSGDLSKWNVKNGCAHREMLLGCPIKRKRSRWPKAFR
jgi:surface protein